MRLNLSPSIYIIGIFCSIARFPFVVSQYEEIVETVADIDDPVGVTYGSFEGKSGLFVSSFSLHDVFFFSSEQLSRYSPVHHFALTRIVAGGYNNVNIDGSFDVASFADPSRMAYDHSESILYVASRLSMTVRSVNFGARMAGTLSDASGTPLDFSLAGASQYSDFPGMDVQFSNSDLLFVTNSKQVFKVVRSQNSFVKTEYESLSNYLQYKKYPYSTCNIYSIAPDNRNKILYVTVSEAKNVILGVPFDRLNRLEPSYVTLVTGREDYTWSGIGTSFPSIVSGGKDETVLGMPMHLQYDATDNLLLWSEGVPLMDGIMTGSLMIRVAALGDSNKTSSVLAGVNAFHNSPIDYEAYMGSTGGYVDGIALQAAFRYPISMVYVRSTNGDGVLSPVLYVADRWNNAIRLVSREVYTAAPSVTFPPTRSPSISQFPSRRPTKSPSRPPVTYVPTLHPSRSQHPTHQFQPTLAPTEPDPPTIPPSSRPFHIHAIGHPTKHPTRAPTAPLPAEIRYEDHSAFGGLGFGKNGVTGLDIFLATLLGLLLAALLIMCFVLKERVDKRRERRKKKMVLRLDDDVDSDDSDEDIEDSTSPAGDVPYNSLGFFGSIKSRFLATVEFSESVFPRTSFYSDLDSETGSVHSDTHMLGNSNHSPSAEKNRVGIGRFFSKKMGSAHESSDSTDRLAETTKSSDSISNMLQKLKIGKRSQQKSDASFTTSADNAAGVSNNDDRSLFRSSSASANFENGVQLNEQPVRGARSATGMAEGSVTRGGSRRSSGPDYL